MVAGLVVGGTEGGLLIGVGGFVGSNAGVILSWVRSGDDQ
jgi:hypothetical protein